MLESIFINLTEAVSGAPHIALVAAFAWGVLSILLSPCHLASIPLIVGFLQGDGAHEVSTRRAAGLSILFALGILVSIALIGAVTAAAGRMLGDLGPWANYAIAAVFFVFGLHLLDVLPLPESWGAHPSAPRRGPWGAFVFGLVFGLALGPCTFGFMAPVLGATFGVAASAPFLALGLLGLFGLGHCAVIGLAGVSTTWVQSWLAWQGGHPGAKWLRRICGLLVLGAGIHLVLQARQG
ncbi:MAG: cytochrome C biogenesis protein [Verrucomicrobia bacterium RIFCSPLOWO2_12_FULL_64_8]|nr:MAG: cytochrome C biogenesis protein [Verrucomicrobia bacterium RIFCSPLOWO2_12_FULL_64_8]